MEIKNLTKVYTTEKKKVSTTALNDVSINFGDKGLIFLLGKSGSGKSTLLNCIGGLDIPTKGEIIVDGKSSSSFSPTDWDAYRNTYLGFVFQEYNLIPDYTVGENIEIALELQHKIPDKSQTKAVLKQVGLEEDFYDRNINELSGGQKQRIAIARTLIKNPKIILADEPTGALDSKTSTQLYDILKELANDKLIIVVTHDEENAKKYGDRIITLSDGEITSDTTEKFATSDSPKQCEFIKSKLSFKRIFSLGAHGLKYKKFRLVTSIILSFITFAAFGIAVTAGFADEIKTEINSMYKDGYHMCSVSYIKDNDSDSVRNGSFTEKQLNVLKGYESKDTSVIRVNGYADGWSSVDDTYRIRLTDYTSYEEKSMYDSITGQDIIYFAELDDETGEKDANLTPDKKFIDKTLCRLPKDYTEVAITDLKADLFIKYGYKAEDGTVYEIKTPDDLIGKKLGSLTICGIYSTEQDKAVYEKYDEYEQDYTYTMPIKDFDIYSNLRKTAQNTMISYAFVKNGYAETMENESVYTTALIKLSGNINKDRQLIKNLTYEENGSYYSVLLKSPYTEIIIDASLFFEFIPYIIIGVCVFLIFAILLKSNFLSVSIDCRKKEIGILRALGADRAEVTEICLMQNFIVAAAELVLSAIMVCVSCVVFNAVFGISLMNFGIVEILLMFIVCFGISTLATIIPTMKISKQQPVDIINDK